MVKLLITKIYGHLIPKQVFNIDDILNFVPEVVDSFSSDFSKVILNYNQPLKLTKKKN